LNNMGPLISIAAPIRAYVRRERGKSETRTGKCETRNGDPGT
jgi:hypothetical protein